MKKFLSLLLAMAMTLSLAACGGSPAQDTPSSEEPADDTQQTEETSGIDASALYAIGGGATGGTFNAMGNLFVQFFNDAERFGQFSSTATTGGVQNVIFMENGTTDFGIIGQSVFVQAVDGTDSFAETGPDDNLVIIAPCTAPFSSSSYPRISSRKPISVAKSSSSAAPVPATWPLQRLCTPPWA